MSRIGEHVPGISCEHQWNVHASGTKGKPSVHVCGYPEVMVARDVFESTGCGASAVFDERFKIVEYDRTYNWGLPSNQAQDVRQAG